MVYNFSLFAQRNEDTGSFFLAMFCLGVLVRSIAVQKWDFVFAEPSNLSYQLQNAAVFIPMAICGEIKW